MGIGLIELLKDIGEDQPLIQRNGTDDGAYWYCKYAPCGGIAHRPEDIAHSPYCPVKSILKQT